MSAYPHKFGDIVSLWQNKRGYVVRCLRLRGQQYVEFWDGASLCRFNGDAGDLKIVGSLLTNETELAAAKAECERLRPAIELLRTADAEIEQLTARVAALDAEYADCLQDRGRVVQDLFTVKADLAAARQSIEVRDTEIARLETDLELARVGLAGVSLIDHWRATHPNLAEYVRLWVLYMGATNDSEAESLIDERMVATWELMTKEEKDWTETSKAVALVAGHKDAIDAAMLGGG